MPAEPLTSECLYQCFSSNHSFEGFDNLILSKHPCVCQRRNRDNGDILKSKKTKDIASDYKSQRACPLRMTNRGQSTSTNQRARGHLRGPPRGTFADPRHFASEAEHVHQREPDEGSGRGRAVLLGVARQVQLVRARIQERQQPRCARPVQDTGQRIGGMSHKPKTDNTCKLSHARVVSPMEIPVRIIISLRRIGVIDGCN